MVKKLLVVQVDRNPDVAFFSHEVRNVRKLELVYFRLMGLDFSLAPPPRNLFVRLDNNTDLRQDLVIPSQNVGSSGNFNKCNSSTVPLHFEIDRNYWDGVSLQSQGSLSGAQPKDMRWCSENSGTCSSFQITLLNERMNPIDLTTTGATLEFVFKLEYDPTSLHSRDWSTNRVTQNSMNG